MNTENNDNRTCVELLALIGKEQADGLRVCRECGNRGSKTLCPECGEVYIADIVDIFTGDDIGNEKFECDFCGTLVKPIRCPHCADNRKLADEIDSLVKELVWHERTDKVEPEGIEYHCSCGCMAKDALSFHLSHEAHHTNPDFTTPEGMHKLFGYLKRLGIWEKLIEWNWDHIDEAARANKSLIMKWDLFLTTEAEILTTPELFLTAVISFLREMK